MVKLHLKRFFSQSKIMKKIKISFKSGVSKMGKNRIIVIPKRLHDKIKDAENRRLRIVVILDDLFPE